MASKSLSELLSHKIYAARLHLSASAQRSTVLERTIRFGFAADIPGLGTGCLRQLLLGWLMGVPSEIQG